MQDIDPTLMSEICDPQFNKLQGGVTNLNKKTEINISLGW